MSFPVDYTTTVDGVTIKCSKTFDQLGSITVDDLREYAIAGIYDIAVGRAGLSCETLSGSAKVKANTPVEYTGVAWDDVRVNFNDGTYNPAVNAPHYGFSILVYGLEGQNIRSITDNSRLVLDVPVQDIYCDMPALTSSTITAQNDSAMSDENSITVYDTNSSGVIKTVANDNNTQIHVMAVFIYDENNFFIVPSAFMGGYSFIHTTYIWGGNYSGAGGSLSGTYWVQPYYAEQYDSQTGIYANMANDMILAGKIISSLDWTKAIVAIFDTGEQEKEQTDAYVVLQYTGMYGSPSFTGYITFYPKTERQSYLGFANSSLKFKYNNTMYKPVIEQGVVIDYTDDMDDPSEFDDIETVTGNNVPITPPTPPTPDNPFDVDAETYGWGGNEVGGMVRYYLLTSTEMDNLVSAMGSSANWVIDYLNNIVSCFIVPNDGIFFDAAIPTTIKFRVDNNNKWDTGVSCKRISGVVNKSGGTIEIPRCTNSFLDFEPYSDYSIYIPFCGRVPIKGNIVCGREITVTYYPDVPTCSLTAVVTCGGSTVAIAKGQYGSMIPVTSSGADRKTAAAISDVSSIITGIGVGIAGAATGNAGLLIAGGSQLVGGLLNTAKDSVQSYAYSSGSSGDTSFFAAGTRCQYYANYLQLDDVVNTSEFGHTIGYLCKEIGKLSNYHGFTICANPHIHISATSTEKDEIKSLLEQGVILP